MSDGQILFKIQSGQFWLRSEVVWHVPVQEFVFPSGIFLTEVIRCRPNPMIEGDWVWVHPRFENRDRQIWTLDDFARARLVVNRGLVLEQMWLERKEA